MLIVITVSVDVKLVLRVMHYMAVQQYLVVVNVKIMQYVDQITSVNVNVVLMVTH